MVGPALDADLHPVLLVLELAQFVRSHEFDQVFDVVQRHSLAPLRARHVGQPLATLRRHDHVVFDSRATPARHIGPRLQGEHHSRLERLTGLVGPVPAHPGPLVHFETQPMAGPVTERVAQTLALQTIARGLVQSARAASPPRPRQTPPPGPRRPAQSTRGPGHPWARQPRCETGPRRSRRASRQNPAPPGRPAPTGGLPAGGAAWPSSARTRRWYQRRACRTPPAATPPRWFRRARCSAIPAKAFGIIHLAASESLPAASLRRPSSQASFTTRSVSTSGGAGTSSTAVLV